MLLPEQGNAVIEPRKLRDYLLSPTHPVGRTKAEFFARLGYKRENWHVLAAQFRKHIGEAEARESGTSEFGTKYEVHAVLTGSEGREGVVVSVWIILIDEDFPRFVTAYPES